ncbi:hydroxylysine kinase [Plakobranchus ocellatus]|uniref:Hydroxylysine kinase n=1 Tax=Plakobranchus ocellatus TaxID=259542 RepID=A0AAV3ZC40_9GAST|nr:hydroxylysine kinase [Plakobranchus ocellatus]
MSSDTVVDSNMNSSKRESGLAVPDEALCPHIEDMESSVKQMLKVNYGLTMTSLKQLNGYDDLNLHVKTEPEYSNSHIDAHHPEGFFLKILNVNDSRRPELMYAQRSLMDHIISKGIVCQEAIRGINGEVFTEITSPNTKGEKVTYLVSLRNFLPGRVMADCRLTAGLLYNLGSYTAKIIDALQDFSHPYYETFDPLWNLSNLSKVSEVTFAVKEEEKRKLSEDVIKQFETQVLPNRHTLRKGQIHGDINENNILVDDVCSDSRVPQFTGLLDFQDSAYSYTVYDISLCISYMLMFGKSDVPQLEIPGHILAGYNSIVELTPAEKRVLRICIAARMVMSLVYGAYTYHMDPSNEYVLETSRFGWQALTQFWAADEQKMQDGWDEIVKSYKSN